VTAAKSTRRAYRAMREGASGGNAALSSGIG
jgi:hypothetical protein